MFPPIPSGRHLALAQLLALLMLRSLALGGLVHLNFQQSGVQRGPKKSWPRKVKQETIKLIVI